MVALLDDDRSGKLGIGEFTQLWTSIRSWCTIFRKNDMDKSGTINARELKGALAESGLAVNRHVLAVLVLRYAAIATKSDTKVERAMDFDSFIHCCIKLQYAIDSWKTKIKSSGLPLDEWVEQIMYC